MKFSTKYKCLLLFLIFINICNVTRANKNNLQGLDTRRVKTNKIKKTNSGISTKENVNPTPSSNTLPVTSTTTTTVTAGPQTSSPTQIKPQDLSKRLSDPDYASLNRTFVTKDLKNFKNERNEWDFKLISSQLDDIFEMFKDDGNKQSITPGSTRGAIKLFIENFELCDDDKNNVLSYIEFKSCLKKNEYFKIFDLDLLTESDFVKKILEINKNYTSLSDIETFTTRIFNTIDENKNGYMNFYDFMILRLISFAWRKCGNHGLFIAEMQFECAIEIIAKTKTLERNSLRTLFETALEISNFVTERYLDLPTFILVSVNYRLFGKINSKSNGNIHKDQLDLALHSSNLPTRYDTEIVNTLANLFDNLKNKPEQGIDPHTFLFIDLALRMFKINQNLNLIDYEGFTNILMNPMFPKKLIEEFFYIPQFAFNADSYNKLVSGNTNKKLDEAEYFMKKFRFRNKNESKTDKKDPAAPAAPEVKSNNNSSAASAPTGNPSNPATSNNPPTSTTTTTVVTRKILVNKNQNQKAVFFLNFNTKSMKHFNFPFVSNLFFKLMDFPEQQKISFEEYLTFLQVLYMFKRFDNFKSGKLHQHELIENFSSFVGFPKPNVKISSRIENFKIVEQDTVLNAFYTYGLLRIEDFKNKFAKQDSLNILINEVDLKLMLNKLNINEFPTARLDSCIAQHDDNQVNLSVPLYDYTCAIGKAINTISIMLQNDEHFNIVQEHNLKLENTLFENFLTDGQVAPSSTVTVNTVPSPTPAPINNGNKTKKI